MKRFFKFTAIAFAVSVLLISCEKKPLTLDNQTSMKTLLKASDEEITELVVKEATKEANLSAEDIDIEYILRDAKSQAIAVKIKANKQKK